MLDVVVKVMAEIISLSFLLFPVLRLADLNEGGALVRAVAHHQHGHERRVQVSDRVVCGRRWIHDGGLELGLDV